MDPLAVFGARTRAWFEQAFDDPTPAQRLGWPAIASGAHTLIQEPTGSGKTLAAFLYGVDRLNERRLYVVENDVKHPPEGYPVAIGRPKWPTPTGRFQINEMIENPDFLVFDFNNPKACDRRHIPTGLNNPLGLRWIGFASAHGWQVGFHGTAKTSVLGQAVSHGCVRMSNPDIVEVYKHVKVGTEVVVEP